MVRSVFNSVADQYDIMNDFMSAGVHRVWKDSLIHTLNPRANMQVLDVAGGTGDIAFRFLDNSPTANGKKTGHVTVLDINTEMLRVGQNRAEKLGYADRADFFCGDAMNLPVADHSQDAYTIAFGIRNVTRVDQAVEEAYRVLKPGGRFLVLEFSPVVTPILQKAYDTYSFNVIPKLGEIIAKDRESYQYLVESIRKFPDPEKFTNMISKAGFERASYRTMTAGIAAIHSGWKL